MRGVAPTSLWFRGIFLRGRENIWGQTTNLETVAYVTIMHYKIKLINREIIFDVFQLV